MARQLKELRRAPSGAGTVGVVLALAVVAVGVVGSVAAGATADSAPQVTVVAAPRWGQAAPGSWAPYLVRLRNDGGVGVEGEVVLVPQTAPAARPGGPPATTPSVLPSARPFVALDSHAMVAPAVRGGGAGTGPPPWPSYRVSVSLPGGSEKSLTVMVLEAPFGYRVELVDRARRTLAGAAGPVPAPRTGTGGARLDGEGPTAVLVLSDVVGAEAVLGAPRPDRVVPGLEVFGVSSPRDVPETALHFSGLSAVILDDFNTATLTDSQRRALQDYVSLGGSLVLAGGAAWSRTLGSLPAGLVPIRPSANAEVSLAPLADLAGETTAVTATVATGERVAGRVMLAGPGGVPLVVEADYGMGRVVQLAYDPLAPPIAGDQMLRGLAWDQALGRITSRWGSLPRDTLGPLVPSDRVWVTTLGGPPRPGVARWGLGLIGLYALLVGPAAFGFSRRRPGAAWLVLPLAGVTIGACLVAAGAPSWDAVVEVRTQGVDGTVLFASYSGSLDLDPRPTVSIPPAGAVSTVFTGTPVFPTVGDVLGSVQQNRPPVPRGAGGGVLRAGGDRPSVQLPTRPWELRGLQTVSVKKSGPMLDAPLRIIGGSKSSPPRIVGTVTNRSGEPVRRLTAQVPDGLARLADEVAPGATVTVDAPLRKLVRGVSSGAPRVGAQPDELASFIAASRVFTGPAQIAVAGLTGPAERPTARHSRIVVNVAVVSADAADTLLAGSGAGRTVSAWNDPARGRGILYDMTTPSGAAPLSVQYSYPVIADGVSDGKIPEGSTVEIYSWSTGRWRTLPANDVNRPMTETPVVGAEINDGVVRIRVHTDKFATALAPQLVLRGDTGAAVTR